MEFRKNVKNRYFIYYLATVIICFVLGYVLLVSLDKISNPSLEELFISIYTVLHNSECLSFQFLQYRHLRQIIKQKIFCSTN